MCSRAWVPPRRLAAKRATTTIPIVMESLSDVVSIGLVPNLARPGGNVTGVSGFAPELSGKWLALIREIFPRGSERPLIIELAARHRLPAIYLTRLFPEAGELLSYGPLPQVRFQRTAVYVDRIRRGARPGELPIERPTTFGLIINQKTAKALGLTIPPSLLLPADQVIE